jgi:hypothetical protein
MFDTAGQYMRMFGDAWTSPLFNGLSQFSMYWRVRPLAGTTKRTILYSTQAASSGAKALGPGTIVPGTGYRVGSYLTVVGGTGTVALFKVNAIDGSGGVTGVDLIDGGGYSVAPTSPAAVTETYPSTAVTPAGTGCTLSLIMSAKGNGGNFARVIHNITSGTGTRKQSMDYIFGDVGTTVTTSASSTTSLGAPNGAALTDTTTFHTLGMEVDFAAGTVNYRYDGAADGSLSITPGVLNNADAVSMLLGNSPAFTALGLFELKAGLLLSEIPSSGRRSSIETYMGAL